MLILSCPNSPTGWLPTPEEQRGGCADVLWRASGCGAASLTNPADIESRRTGAVLRDSRRTQEVRVSIVMTTFVLYGRGL
eukprot:8218530-Pyramimonas_sp.AAC.1